MVFSQRVMREPGGWRAARGGGGQASRPIATRHGRCAREGARDAAWRCAPFPGRWGVTRRRALRGPGALAGGRGRTETPPAKLSTCATCHAHGTLPTRGAPGGAMVGRRASRLAPYRHYTRALCTQNSHAWGTCIAQATRWSPVGAPHPCGAIIGCRASRLHTARLAARKMNTKEDKDHSDEGIGTQRR